MTKQFTGLYTAIITPFNNGKIDFESLEKIVEEQIKAGVDGIVPVGTTGESATLTPEEHRQTVKFVIDITKKRVKVVAGSGSNSTAEAIEYSKEAQEDGADGLLVITPYCNRPTQKGLLAHYHAIANEVNIPIIVYNIPGRTAVKLNLETTLELSKHKLIQGIKDASSDFESISEIIKRTPDNFCVLSGNDNETLEICKLGGDGVIAVASNLIPKELKEFVDFCLAKNWTAAEAFQNKHNDFFRDLFIETNPIPVKTLMAHLGICKEEFRLPLTTMYDHNKTVLLEMWNNLKS